ncbi:MAG: DUF4065 domain-containing protein [Treponema sp.]|jgi:uncharacterized phage-associated protein|nr:DUF4065 domain-containing protein [Treponema sp.]
MASAGEVAKYIIKSMPVDNLKLQKLLYYSQAVYLVLNNKKPLFPEPIEAWDYGPVVPPVYREYKSHGLETIPVPQDDNPLNLAAEEIVSIDMALAYFGEMSGLALMSSTHQETPWKKSYHPGWPSNIIPIDLIYDYFKDTLEFEDDQ